MTCRFSRGVATCAALSAPFLTGCAQGAYSQFRVFQEPLEAAVAGLRPGESDLTETLDALGAPVFVVEVGLGMALAWGWQATTDWNVQVTGPGNARGRFQYASSDERTEGLVLFFDPAWTLTSLQSGHLVDLLPKSRRPRDIYDDLLDDVSDDGTSE
ncbi:hypothetical protein Poly30_44750 [Planctomycetes bacterium Poly30]|uniref:Uncharacterized protein n=1 Tax=Saltatorellus ferox TaxID=2528018 RepID=A0A518EXV4_9BACT|nr:hypothetical protein Poly30_44750 [Planctomycetes bacterium Poly30]